MIYAGLISFDNAYEKDLKLSSILKSYTRSPPTVVRKNGLTLCYGKLSDTQDKDQVWENASSVLIGHVFTKDPRVSFTENYFKNASNLNKEKILEKIWGKYVYININKEELLFEIVVDLTGQLPFFYYILPNRNILFSSNIEIIFKVLAKKPEYNWEYLCSYLFYSDSSSIITPFKDIYELPPSCCLKITKNERRTETFWNPLSSYEKNLSYSKREAVEVIQETLKPLIEPYQNICVSLSGGLDSSSLVYCLNSVKKKDQILSAQNHFHADIKSSNELFYARKVCKETGIELLEVETSHPLPFSSAPKNLPLKPNKPFSGLITSGMAKRTSDYLPSDGSCIFLSGHGGDHIFQRPPSQKSASDYFLEVGLRGFKDKLNDIAHFYRDSIFSILKKNITGLPSYFLLRRLEKRHTRDFQDKTLTPKWIKGELLKQVSFDFKHPIYEELPSRILPGKYDQINSLYEGLASIQVAINPMKPTYYPFFCEPIVEFALSFPSYKLFSKGYDRYPLRQSVSARFKTETVWRRDKGHTTGIFQQGLKKNIEYVLSLCLEGQLVKQGFIDKDKLHKTILLISSGDINYMQSFTNLALIEMFINSWEKN